MDRAPMLRLRSRQFFRGDLVVMAIVNRTPDSFYDRGATYAEDAARERVRQVVAEGADLIDVGGVKAGYGPAVDAAEEIRRTAGFVAAVRAEFPDLPISVDTWRSEVAREAARAGADVLNDAWGGHDPALLEVAAEYDLGVVCCHTGGLAPRTDPHRVAYDDVVADVVDHVTAMADRAVRLGVARDKLIIDPCHDFGKNTWHSLEITRRLDELVDTGWPVLVSMSNKDFIGEALAAPAQQRLLGTLAASAVSAWLGATVFRAHNVLETRTTLDMVATIRGDRPPARAVRGMA